jgi:large subunit ribosomal protein L18
MGITKSNRRLRIRRGIRKQIAGTSERPRLSIFKSNKAVYAQIVDDVKGHTIAAANTAEMGTSNNIESSKQVGIKLAERAKAAGIENIVFDRGGYQYHGKVKALADGAREGGLKF